MATFSGTLIEETNFSGFLQPFLTYLLKCIFNFRGLITLHKDSFWDKLIIKINF